MSDNTEKQTPEQATEAQKLIDLKQAAISIGMRVGTDFHPNIGYEKLLDKMDMFQEKIAADYQAKMAPKSALPKHLPITAIPETETKNERRMRLMKDANRYVRVIVTCMNQDKAEWDGEFLCAGNGLIGSIRKFVPFNREIPYHVPRILVELLRERTFTKFVTVRGKFGVDTKKGIPTREFNIVEFDDLTIAEHEELRRQQAIRAGGASQE